MNAGVVDMALLVEHLPQMHEALDLIPVSCKWRMVTHIYNSNSNTAKAEARRSRCPDHAWLQSDFKLSLEYLRTHFFKWMQSLLPLYS